MSASIQGRKSRRVRQGSSPLSDSEFVGRFQRGAALPADYGGTVSAGEGVINFFGTSWTVKGGNGFWCWILRAGCHAEGTVAQEVVSVSPVSPVVIEFSLQR